MAGLSLMQMRSFIDRLGDLDDEVTRVCRAAELIAKRVGKDQASGAERLKEAQEALKEKQKSLRDAKECLLGFDGFLHAESGAMRAAMVQPKMGSFFGRVGDRMMPVLEAHIGIIVDEIGDGLRRVRSSVRDLREAEQDAEGRGNIKESVKTLGKVCSAAERAIGKAMKANTEASTPEHGYEHMHAAEEPEEAGEEPVVEKTATDVGFHGYNLTAKELPEFIKKKIEEREGKKDDEKEEKGKEAKKLPPEFLENIEKKKEEAAKKKEDEDEGKKAHGYDLTAESLVPGNKSKGPKELGQEEMGWDPGHRTTQKPVEDEDEEKKKAHSNHGYDLTG